MERYGPEDLVTVARQGAHLVEVDFHVTGDDEFVARHDPRIRQGNDVWWFADRSLEELRGLLAREGALTAEEVVAGASVAGVGLYADIKSATPAAIERFVELLDVYDLAGMTILASVRSDIVAVCSQVAPSIPGSVLFASMLEEPVQLAESVGAHYVHPCWERHPNPDQLVAGDWVDRVRTNGLGVICWHEERPAVLASLCRIGVDGICTDLPDLLTRVALSG